MAKRPGPTTYSDLGKEAKDLLYKGYLSAHKISVATKTLTGSVLTFSLTRGDDRFVTGLNMRLNDYPMTNDMNVDSSARQSITVTMDELASGVRMLCSYADGVTASDKIEVIWQHNYGGISAISFGAKHPFVILSTVVGTKDLFLGMDLRYDLKTGDLTTRGAGVSFSYGNLITTMAVKDKGTTLSASFCNTPSPQTLTSVGAEFARNTKTDDVTFTVGAQQVLDPLTSVKARADSSGKISAMVQHEFCSNTHFTISGEVDLLELKKLPKVGIAVALNF